MRMTAAVLHEQGRPAPFAESRPFAIEEVEIEGPGPGEVMLEVMAAGLCHSDLSIVEGVRARPVPFVGGHEGAGVVREVGAGVQGLAPGDHVVMTVGGGCGCCHSCTDGRPVLCDSIAEERAAGMLPGGVRRLSRGGAPLNHYFGASSFAQYAVTAPYSLVKIDPAVPFDVAAMFGCAVVTGAGAALNAAKLRPGRTVAVIGLGGVGLSAVMTARLMGAARIIGIDLRESKFPLAMELGCTDCIAAADPEIVAKVRDLTRGGVDYVFEVSGARPAMQTAFEILRKGGEAICIGLGAVEDRYPYPHSRLVAEEKVFRGSLMGSGSVARDIPLLADYYLAGRLPLDKLTSGRMDFDGINAGFDSLARGEALRQILRPNG